MYTNRNFSHTWTGNNKTQLQSLKLYWKCEIWTKNSLQILKNGNKNERNFLPCSRKWISNLSWCLLHPLSLLSITSAPGECLVRIDFCPRTCLSPQNGYVLPQIGFRSFFWKYCVFQKTCLIIKYPIPFRDKNGYINFSFKPSTTSSLKK